MALDSAVDGFVLRDFNSAVGYIEGLSETKLQAYRGRTILIVYTGSVSQEIMPTFLRTTVSISID